MAVSKDFEKYKERYNRGGCTKVQLKELVVLTIITATEYQQITGEAYVA